LLTPPFVCADGHIASMITPPSAAKIAKRAHMPHAAKRCFFATLMPKVFEAAFKSPLPPIFSPPPPPCCSAMLLADVAHAAIFADCRFIVFRRFRMPPLFAAFAFDAFEQFCRHFILVPPFSMLPRRHAITPRASDMPPYADFHCAAAV
jgi:hypothetical protein